MAQVPIEYVDGRKALIDKQKAHNIVHARGLTAEQDAFKKTVKNITLGGVVTCIHRYVTFEDKMPILSGGKEFNPDALHTIDIFNGIECANCKERKYHSVTKPGLKVVTLQ
jgi:hypothetical protein